MEEKSTSEKAKTWIPIISGLVLAGGAVANVYNKPEVAAALSNLDVEQTVNAVAALGTLFGLFRKLKNVFFGKKKDERTPSKV